MNIQAIKTRLSSCYGNAVAKRTARKMENPVNRQNAIMKYLSKVSDKTVDCAYNPSYEYVCNTAIEKILSGCKNQIPIIHGLMGTCGLALYGNLPIESLMTSNDKNIKEVPYEVGKPAEVAIYNYILSNDWGNVKDLNIRYGKLGNTVLKHCLECGFAEISNDKYNICYNKKDEMVARVAFGHTLSAINFLSNDV